MPVLHVCLTDNVTGRSRGWMILQRPPSLQQPSLFELSRRACDWRLTAQFVAQELPDRLARCPAPGASVLPADPTPLFAHILDSMPDLLTSVVTTVGPGLSGFFAD